MTASLLPNGKQQFIDANGNPLTAGSVYFYIPGTTTPKDTWQDSAETILNTNPVVLDSSGQAVIYGNGAYRQIVKDAVGNTIWDQVTSSVTSDNILPTQTGKSGAFLQTDGTNVAWSSIYVADRPAMAAYAPSTKAAIYLMEPGREGQFVWNSSDLSTYVTADTQQGIYVPPAADTTGASGAWVRAVWNETWLASWFGVNPNDASVSPAVDAMFALANVLKPRWIAWSSGIHVFGAQVRKLAYIWGFLGGTSGAQPTIFMKAYAETDDARGMIHCDDYGGTWQGINFRANSASSGGSLLSFMTTGTATNIGEIHGYDFIFSGGDYVKHGLYINGETANVDPKGVRNVYLDRFYIFNSLISGLYIKSAQSVHIGVGTVTSAGGSGTFPCIITGVTDVNSDNVLVNAVLACNVALDNLSNAIIQRVTGNLSTTNNVTDTKIVSLRGGMAALDGGIANWGDGCGVISTGLHSSGSGWEKHINGWLSQRGTGTTSSGTMFVNYSKNFAATPVKAYANVTDNPNANISLAQCYSIAVGGMSVKTFDLTTTGAGATSVNFEWFAEGY